MARRGTEIPIPNGSRKADPAPWTNAIRTAIIKGNFYVEVVIGAQRGNTPKLDLGNNEHLVLHDESGSRRPHSAERYPIFIGSETDMILERLCNRYCADWPECACGQSSDDQPHACVTSSPTAKDVVIDLATLCGRLGSVVEWCVENDGKCLADNPDGLAFARRALNMARGWLPK